MRTGMFALGLGLLALRFTPVLPPGWVLLLWAILGLMLLPFRSYPVALFLWGFSWACFSAQQALDQRLDGALEGRTLWVEGRVVGLPERGEATVRFELLDAQSRRARLPQRIRLSWPAGPPVLSGERWRLAVTFKRPVGLLNPHLFDYEAWLLAKRIGAIGSVKAGHRLTCAQGSWRDPLRQRLARVDTQGQGAGLAALVLGDGSGLQREDWQVLQETGTVHLLVISGQHIGLLGGLVYALVAALARYGLWPKGWPWLPWACGLAFVAALGYAALAGFGVPVQRACLMFAMVLLWRLRFRHLGVWWPWLVAFDVVLLLEPLASLQPGFWLSFGAVAILLFGFSARLGGWSLWQAVWRPQWLIALGLLPLLWGLDLPISFSAPLANVLAVPWLGFLVLPLALLGTSLLPVPYVGAGLLWLAGGLLKLLFQVLAVLAGWLPAWTPPAIGLWFWLATVLGVWLLLLPKGVPLRVLGWPLLLLAVLAPVEKLAYGRAEVWQLDVGQGLAILVRTRNHAMLYDAGPRVGDFDLGERVVLPFLHKQGVAGLDVLLISHADSDHAGGALAVQRGIPVNRVLSGDAPALPEALAALPCAGAADWHWDQVSFSLWQWPDAVDSNQRSCVLQIEANGEKLLLTGDIDIHAERALLASPLGVPSHWLQAPHHGSRSSSSMRFLRGVAPRAVLISRGRSNSFGHPHPWVMARYRALGMQIHDSAQAGAVRLRLGDFGPAEPERERRRFWRGAGSGGE